MSYIRSPKHLLPARPQVCSDAAPLLSVLCVLQSVRHATRSACAYHGTDRPQQATEANASGDAGERVHDNAAADAPPAAAPVPDVLCTRSTRIC